MPPAKRGLALLIFGILLLGGLIALDQLVINNLLASSFGQFSDLSFYQERAQAILDGKLLYRDVQSEAPPLIAYFFVIPQLMGGSLAAYQSYFAAFTLLTALTLYYGLKRWDDLKAFKIGIIYLLSPFGVIESVFGVQDESIMVFLFLLAVILAIRGSGRLSAITVAIGIWTKVFAGLFYPILFLKTKSWRERLIHLGIISVFSVAISLPFLILAPNEFLNFPTFYFLGGSAPPATGISIWDFLGTGGLNIPGIALLAVALAGLLGGLWLVKKRDLEIWQGTLLIMVIFLVFYSRILVGYYILPVALLLVWAVDDRKMLLKTFLLYLPFFASLAFTRDTRLGHAVIDASWSWVAGLALSLLGTLMLVDLARQALRVRPFIYRSREKNEENRSV
ncbi:MAG: glycosyltransferase 87 family protein [Methanomassiliicoccales archaeon]|nr:glycosyltransferase 87 family protein [Methanomassiliicoccales archaeon]